ncbi:MAG: stage V sporulation protein AD, partial [Oscillospiraceae bacterium]|nr:stage V sporulation protein AD [Oscillospiraceae bacterium]
MKMTNEEYAAYIKQKMPRSPLWKDMALAFVIGGAICCVGQGVTATFSALGASEEDAGTWTS